MGLFSKLKQGFKFAQKNMGTIGTLAGGFAAGGPMGLGLAAAKLGAGRLLSGGGGGGGGGLPNLGVYPLPPPSAFGGGGLVSPQIPIGVQGAIERQRRQNMGRRMLMPGSGAGLASGGVGMMPSHSSIPAVGTFALDRRRKFSRQEAFDFYMATGIPPPGWHNTRTGMIAVNRRMNPLNPRALGRALRRARSFAKIAKRAITLQKSPAPGVRFKTRRRRAA